MEVRRGYKQTEVGVIPEDWDVKSLQDGIKLLSGHHVLARHCNTDGIGFPYITGPADFPDGVIQHSKFTEKPSTICRANDILVTVKGSGAGTIVLSDAEYCISRQLMAIRVGDWDTKFIYFLLVHDSSLFGAAATGLIPGLSRSDILGKQIPIPPIAEQRAIAAALSDVDSLLSALDALIAKKRLIKQGVMQELLTGKKRLPGFSGKWEVKTLGEIGNRFLNGGTPSTRNAEYWKGAIPWITGADVVDQKVVTVRRFITDEAVKNSATSIVEKGNLLIVTRTGVGKIAIAPFDVAISQDLTGVYIKEEYALPEFLFWYFDYNSSSLRNLNQGTSIAGITRDTLISMSICLPSLGEQTAIAEILSNMDAEIAALEARREKTRLLKQGMMQELLTGKTRLL